MTSEKVAFGFFVLLAATLNFGFFIGDVGDPEVHNPWELFLALIVTMIAAILKFGDPTRAASVHLGISLVAVLHLVVAAVLWVYFTQVSVHGLDRHAIASVVSLSGGALLANLVSVVLLIVEASSPRRR